MMPNMEIAKDTASEYVTLFWDCSTGQYGIRKCEQIIKDGIFLEATKAIVMSKQQLLKIIEEASTFVKDR